MRRGRSHNLALAAAAAAVAAALLLACCGGGGASGSTTASRSLTASTSPLPSTALTRPLRGAVKHPNIVFVLTDDLSWNLVRFMPHVLAMQREGETFTRYYVTDSLCCPSRASIFTGMYPHDTKVFSNTPPDGGFWRFRRRGEQHDTFAIALQRQGYATAMMGKYLNGYHPTARRGGLRAYMPPGWSEWDVVGNGYAELGYHMNSDGRVRLYGYRPQDYLTEVLSEKALGFIDRSAARRQPFMLEVGTFAPHRPYVPAPRDAHDFPGLTAPRNPAFDARNTHRPAWLRYFGALTPSEIQAINHDFRLRAQSVQAIDRMVGRIEARLKALRIGRETYIVFSSDNGLHMGEHRMMPGKLTAFESDIHVPLIVLGPHVPHGRRVSAMAENIDLCPTFERLGRAPVPSTVDGHSLLGLLRGLPVRHWRRYILVEHHKPPTALGDPDRPIHDSGNPPTYNALRSQHGLYVRYQDGEQEYFDLRNDPWEIHNIVSQLPRRRIEQLRRRLHRLKHCHGTAQCWRAAGG